MTTAKSLRNLKPGLHHTGTPNLYLQVTRNKKTGTIRRSWIYRFKSAYGWTRSMGLGSFKAITLKTAKELAEQQAKLRQQPQGDDYQDPISLRKRARLEAREKALTDRASQVTLKQATDKFLDENGNNWSDSYADKWKRSFEQHLYPTLNKPLLNITKEQVIAALKPTFQTAPRQAKIIQEHLQTILDWCIHKEYCQQNPAKWKGNLAFEFKNNGHKTRHHASLDYKDAPNFYKALTTIDTTTANALRFILLTSVRCNEALEAVWEEFDLDNKLWIIPAERMKMDEEHKVPLSNAAINLLKQHNSRKFVFPGRNKNEPISDTSLRLLKDKLGYERTTIHGLRSTFRTWADEQTSFAFEVKEAALAHQVKEETVRAYARGKFLALRAQLMDEWAAYCNNTQTPL